MAYFPWLKECEAPPKEACAVGMAFGGPPCHASPVKSHRSSLWFSFLGLSLGFEDESQLDTVNAIPSSYHHLGNLPRLYQLVFTHIHQRRQLVNIIDASSCSTMLAIITSTAIPPPSSLSFHSKPTPFLSSLDANVSHKYTKRRRLGPSRRSSSRRLSSPPPPSCAAEKEETQFEIDREKAREALQKLDQQLQTLSQQESPPKKRPSSPSLSDLNLDRDRMTGMGIGEMPEISGSYLSYIAVALLILTIFNNIIFNAFIKPSVDGKEEASKIERVPLREPAEQPMPQVPQ